MIADYQVGRNVFLSQVNFWLGTFLLLIFTLGACLLIWHAATGLNPIADALAAQLRAGDFQK